MVLSRFTLDMSKYVVPLALAREGDGFEIDHGIGVWRYGFLDGKVWRSADGVICQLDETKAIRLPEPLVRYWIGRITDAIAGRFSGYLATVAEVQVEVSRQASLAALDMVPLGDDCEPSEYAEVNRMRRQLLLDAMAFESPSTPLSEIVVSYRARNKRGEVVDEYGVAEEAWTAAHVREETGQQGVGIVFADGSVVYGHPLVREMMVSSYGHLNWEKLLWTEPAERKKR